MDKQAKDILAKFKKAKEKRMMKDPTWKELDAFDRGDQWQLNGNIPPWVPKPVTNFIHLVKTTKRAALAIENPTGKLRPQSPIDIQNIETLQKIYEFVWDKSKSRKVTREVIETAKLLGTGIAQVYWDENTGVLGGTGGLYEGEIKVRQLDVSSVYPDPTAFCLEDCQFIHVVERKPVEWLKKHPVFGTNDIEARSVASNESGEIYHRDDLASSRDGLVDFHQHFEKKQNSEGGFDYSVTYLAGEKVVHKIDKLEPNCYPFAIMYDFPQRQDFWGKGTCELILDNQKLINKVESIIAMIGTLLQNPQKIVSKSSGINPREAAKYSNAPGHTFVANGDPSRAIIWQQPPQIPPSLFNLAEQAKQNIREITGLTESYMGQSVGSLQTSSGVNSLIERSTMRDRDQMYDVEMFIEQLSKILIKFITTKYTEERYMRIMKENEDIMEFVKFVGTDYKDLEYDLHIDVSATAPITRARQREEARNLLEINYQYGITPRMITPQEFVKQSDFANKDDIIKRMNAEEVQSYDAIMQEVLKMSQEAIAGGVSPEEVTQMSQQMLAQRLEEMQKGLGSTGGGTIQDRQAGM